MTSELVGVLLGLWASWFVAPVMAPLGDVRRRRSGSAAFVKGGSGLVAGEVSPAVWCGGVAARETRTTSSECGAGDGAESTASARDAADGEATKVLSPPTCSEMKRRRDGDAVEWTRLGEGEGAWGA